jgi:hypothetical protein
MATNRLWVERWDEGLSALGISIDRCRSRSGQCNWPTRATCSPCLLWCSTVRWQRAVLDRTCVCSAPPDS